MSDMNNDSVLRRSEHAVHRIVDGEAVIVEPNKGLVNVVNDSGTRIWELLDGQRTVGAIAESIEREFDVPAETALADALEFLRDCAEKGLVV
ncbi:MAG: PqqD family protein [Kiritimatiellae bacterium]|nr:PqqD family protein [Kiritimatiellia bacterium]